MTRFQSALEWLILGLVITVAAATVPDYASGILRRSVSAPQNLWIDSHIGTDNLSNLLLLAFGLLLVLPAPVRAGLAVPRLRGVWPGVAVIVVGCLTLAYLFSARLNMPELRGRDSGYWMWLIGPPAEDLIFAGFLFGKFDELWPRPVARWIPINRAVIISACYFSLWHAQNFLTTDPAFVRQQMAYTFAGAIVLGLTRQWSGSLLFVTLTHMGANYIAWRS
jgi:membrane protease YdiL (CAAX protease family)